MLGPGESAARASAAPPLDHREPRTAREQRPTHAFDQAIFDEICERLATGEEDLTQICNSDLQRMPSYDSIRNWAEAFPDSGRAIARARARGFDEIARRARLIARGDKAAGSTGDTQRDRLIVDTDLKLLAKWDPKRYGDLLKLGGPSGEALAPPVVNQFVVQPVIAVARPADDDAQLPALDHKP